MDRREWSGPMVSENDRKDNLCLCGMRKKRVLQQIATRCGKYHGQVRGKCRAYRLLPLLQHFLEDIEEVFLKRQKLTQLILISSAKYLFISHIF